MEHPLVIHGSWGKKMWIEFNFGYLYSVWFLWTRKWTFGYLDDQQKDSASWEKLEDNRCCRRVSFVKVFVDFATGTSPNIDIRCERCDIVGTLTDKWSFALSQSAHRASPYVWCGQPARERWSSLHMFTFMFDVFIFVLLKGATSFWTQGLKQMWKKESPLQPIVEFASKVERCFETVLSLSNIKFTHSKKETLFLEELVALCLLRTS